MPALSHQRTSGCEPTSDDNGFFAVTSSLRATAHHENFSGSFCSGIECLSAIKLTDDNFIVKNFCVRSSHMQSADPEFPASPTLLKAPRPRGRPTNDAAAAVREEVVLDLAFKAFAQRGYEATTLRDLAKELGVSHNLINVRFGSKADLWRRAVDARVARVAPPVMAAFDA